MNYLEIIGVLLGLLYLYLEYRASTWLWIVGVIMPAIYIIVYYEVGLYADMGISAYYILASVYGFIVWWRGARRDAPSDEERRIISMPKSYYLPLGLLTAALTMVIGYVLVRFTDSTVPWADGFTTAVSVVAMWMLARKFTQQWLAWIIADVACGILYFYKELWFTGGLYLLYSVIAYFGYKRWQKLSIR